MASFNRKQNAVPSSSGQKNTSPMKPPSTSTAFNKPQAGTPVHLHSSKLSFSRTSTPSPASSSPIISLSRPGSSLSTISSVASSSGVSSATGTTNNRCHTGGTSPCKQCQILKRRIKQEYNNTFHRRSPGSSVERSKSALSNNSSRATTPSLSTSPSTTGSRYHHQPQQQDVGHHLYNQLAVTDPPREPATQKPAAAGVAAAVAVATKTIQATSQQVWSMTTTINQARPQQQQTQQTVEPRCSSTIHTTMATEPPQLGFLVPWSSLLILLFSSTVLVLFGWIQRVQPLAYIDEVFHIPQAQQYCLRDSFATWDNKITTPPGLYLFSYVLLRPLAYLLGSQQVACSVTGLRATNLLFTFGNFLLLLAIFQRKMDLAKKYSSYTSSPLEVVLSATSVALLPPLFFFTFLYYTDPGSMFSILLAQWYALQGRHQMAAIIGFGSLWFRQTNIVWIFLAAALCTLNITFNLIEDVYSYQRYQFFLLGFTKRFPLRECRVRNWRYSLCLLYDFTFDVMSTCGGYLLDGMLFIAFLYLNNGIVLGDRSAHQASVHLAQLPYYLTFSLLFGWPLLLTRTNVRNFYHFIRGHPLTLLTLTGLLYLCQSDLFTYVHPYLLADNRHYVFYVWRRLWSNPTIKLLPIPVLVFTAVTMWNMADFVCYGDKMRLAKPKANSPKKSLAQQSQVNNNNNSNNSTAKQQLGKIQTARLFQANLSKLLYTFSVLITIVPQQLIEFRYFLVPYLLWRLHLKKPSSLPPEEDATKKNKPRHAPPTALIIEFLWYIAVNAVTISLFTLKTIKYSDTEPNQRLIW